MTRKIIKNPWSSAPSVYYQPEITEREVESVETVGF